MATHPPDGPAPSRTGIQAVDVDTDLTTATHGDGDPGASRKAELRQQFRRARAALDETDRRAQADAVARHLADWLLERGADPARPLALYHPTRDELDPRPVVDALSQRLGAPWPAVYPRCIDDTRLEFCPPPTEDDGWARNRVGILEPTTPPVDPSTLDFVLVPALAVDVAGTRLGYGGGYYDRFLAGVATLAARTIATVFDVQVVSAQRLPREPFDVPVAWLATHRGVQRTAPLLTATPGAG